jgi:hypothetical protein
LVSKHGQIYDVELSCSALDCTSSAVMTLLVRTPSSTPWPAGPCCSCSSSSAPQVLINGPCRVRLREDLPGTPIGSTGGAWRVHGTVQLCGPASKCVRMSIQYCTPEVVTGLWSGELRWPMLIRQEAFQLEARARRAGPCRGRMGGPCPPTENTLAPVRPRP